MKKIYAVLNDCNQLDNYYETLKEAKDNAFSDCVILEVTDVIDCEYSTKYIKRKLNEKV